MKILHVITGLAKAAGTSVFCAEICNALSAQGHDVTVAVRNPSLQDCCPLEDGVHLVSIDKVLECPNTVGFELVHIHALWAPILHKVSTWAHRFNLPVVWSTHGMTAPWAMAHKRWKKIIPWLLYQCRDLANATCLHCTTGQEAGWVRSLGFRNEICIVPLGTNLGLETDAGDLRHIVLFVGRIYPVKGLENLIRAWKMCGQEGWTLRLVGPDQAGYQAELSQLARTLGLSVGESDADVEFVGPRYGNDLMSEYRRAWVSVLPSFTENFGGVVVDSLAAGCPVIASRFTPWQELEQEGCGWWVENDPVHLGRCLSAVMEMPREKRSEMGTLGRAFVVRKYTWKAVGRAMEDMYRHALSK